MNKDAKRINPNHSAAISRVKGYIRNNNGKGFDGDGYIFKEALRQLRKDGMKIIYDRKKGSYFKV